MRLFGRTPMPAVLRDQVKPRLGRGEHIAAWAAVRDGSAVAATDAGLFHHDGSGFVLLPWADVETATWRDGALTVVEASSVFGSGRRHVFDLVDAHQLPEVVRTRVESTIALSRHHRLPAAGRAGVRVVARRQPHSITLRWMLVYDPGVNSTDPSVAEQAEALLAQAKGSVAAAQADLI
ncbi:MAG: hypothetical protein M3Z02_00290 [Actinomycetota bacterium]|nr:hypothetical protein [Actinomycetota bacterium]